MKYFCGVLLCLCCACAPALKGPAVPPASSVAVADFIFPRYDWELLAGVLPEEQSVVDAKILRFLDERLVALLRRGTVVLASSRERRGCEERIQGEKSRRRQETVGYWRQVGECLGVEYVLVPYVMDWRNRQGGEYGVEVPAKVELDVYLLHVASGQLRRAHFEEEQRGLGEDLLRGKRFFQRKGRWLTPEELAEEGLAEGLRELGL